MDVQGLTPILNVSDMEASVDWFVRLGWTLGFAWGESGEMPAGAVRNADGVAGFARVDNGKVSLFLCQGAQGAQGALPAKLDGSDDFGATWQTWWLPSRQAVTEAHARAVAEGITVVWPPTDEPWGVRECRIMHPDGHVFRLSCGLP